MILSKYADFADILSSNFAAELFEYIRINNHAIKLVDSLELLYKPIYNLKLVELDIFKPYIETNLTNIFINSSKFFANTLIFFV